MGFLKDKYTKEYFLNVDSNDNNLNYGALDRVIEELKVIFVKIG